MTRVKTPVAVVEQGDGVVRAVGAEEQVEVAVVVQIDEVLAAQPPVGIFWYF